MDWNWAKEKNGNIDFSKPFEKGPNSNGFDYAYGFCGSLDMPPYVYVENGKSTAISTETTENTYYQAIWRKGITVSDFVHEDTFPNFFEWSFKYIQEHANSEKSFFLFMPLPSPHTPILPTKEWQGKSGLNPYADYVMITNYYMAELQKVIKAAGISDNTLIVFTSDNGCSLRAKIEELEEKGPSLNYIYRDTKADIFEGGQRIPLIVS